MVNRDLTPLANHGGMKPHFAQVSPEVWLLDLFSSQASRTGSVIRRQIRDIERYYGRDAFLAEMQRRGYAVVENAGQFVIFCNQEPIRRVV